MEEPGGRDPVGGWTTDGAFGLCSICVGLMLDSKLIVLRTLTDEPGTDTASGPSGCRSGHLAWFMMESMVPDLLIDLALPGSGIFSAETGTPAT